MGRFDQRISCDVLFPRYRLKRITNTVSGAQRSTCMVFVAFVRATYRKVSNAGTSIFLHARGHAHFPVSRGLATFKMFRVGRHTTSGLRLETLAILSDRVAM